MDETVTRKALPAQTRSANLVPSTYNEAERSVEVVFAAGGRVLRTDWWTDEKYEEELAVTDDAVDFSHIEAGVVQVLDNHAAYAGVRGVLGVVERGWIEGGEARAKVRLSADPSKAGIVEDIKAGILRAVSVGYTVQRYEITPAEQRTDGGVPLWRAARWLPQEISFVTIPADPAASVRSASTDPEKAPTAPCDFVTRGAAAIKPKERPMDPQETAAETQPVITQSAPAAPVSAAAPSAPAAATSPAVDANALVQRAAEISDLCTRHAVPHMAAQLIRSGADLASVKDQILTAIAVRDAAGTQRSGPRIETVQDEGETRLRGMEDALFSRLVPGFKLDDNGRQYRHLTLIEMGREHLERSGMSVRQMDKLKIAENMLRVRSAGMHSTSDFGSLFSNVAGRRLAAVYAAYPATYATWARQGPNLADFKPMDVISMSGAPDLLKVNEHGEFKYGTFGGSAEQYQLATYGRIVAMTRQAIINDDLRSFDRLISAYGTSARRLENRLVYEQLTANGAMADGTALFHSSHGNLLTGSTSALTLEGLEKARTALRKQKGSSGEAISVAPRYLIVPAALETKAYQLTSNAYTPASPADVNDFRQGGRTQLEVIVEPQLDDASATAWYLAADSALIDTVEYAYLDGAAGPVTETREGFEVDGTEVKCRLDFAAKVLDWRGLVKSNGA